MARPEAPPAEAPAMTATEPRDTPLAAAEKSVTLSNDAVEIRVSNLGARVNGVSLLKYKATVDPHSGPVELATSPTRGAMFLFLGPEPLRSLEAAPAEVTSSGPRHVELRA